MIASTAYTGCILYIMKNDASAPRSDRYHLDLKVGRYDGLPAKCSKKLMAQSVPYVTMKNILIICATKLTLPNETKTTAITDVTKVAFTGSFAFPLPELRYLFTFPTRENIIRSKSLHCPWRDKNRTDGRRKRCRTESDINNRSPQCNTAHNKLVVRQIFRCR